MEININNKDNLASLKGLLDNDSDIINYFKVREKLFSIPFDTLSALSGQYKSEDSFSRLLRHVLSQREKSGLFVLDEDILINNTPLLNGSPFYPDSKKPWLISSLSPEADHLYLTNLKLKYTPLDLKCISGSWWAKDDILKSPLAELVKYNNCNYESLLPVEDTAGPSECSWKYSLKKDKISPFLVNLAEVRNWVKIYEGSRVKPHVFRDSVFIRNSSRLFCLDMKTGQLRWSLGNFDGKEYELYQVFDPPYLNYLANDFILEEGIVYADFRGNFTAIDVKNASSGVVLWKCSLGEYRMCVKPVLCKGVIVAGLINSRGELWFCGFSKEKGIILWSNYIGTSAYAGSLCALSISSPGRVIIGTNHGILFSLDPDKGIVEWIRKYDRKTFDLLLYWQKGFYSQSFKEEGMLAFDTEFLEYSNGVIIYKPLESDYVYLLEAGSGKLLNKILIDPENYYVLSVKPGKMILLEKPDEKDKEYRIKVIDIKSGMVTYVQKLNSGKLLGVIYFQDDRIALKINSKIHILKISETSRGLEFYREYGGFAAEYWLLSLYGNNVFLSDMENLLSVSLTVNKEKEVLSLNKNAVNNSELICAGLKQAITHNAPAAAIKVLTENAHWLRENGFSSELLGILQDERNALGLPQWDAFVKFCAHNFGNMKITYRDISISFNNFLTAIGLFVERKPSNMPLENKGVSRLKDKYQVSGEQLFMLPVKNIKGKVPDFYLLLNNDQLICVSEAGKIIWARSVFYCPRSRIIDKADKRTGRMYIDSIEAYKYENVVIVNDHVNILALDISSGQVIWSISDQADIFSHEGQYYSSEFKSLYTPYYAHKEFVEKTMLLLCVYGDDIAIVRGKSISIVDPKTGFCRQSSDIPVSGAIQALSDNKFLFLLSYHLDKLIVLDKQLHVVKIHDLGFMQKAFPKKMVFIQDFVALHVIDKIHLIDPREGLKYTIDTQGNAFESIENYNGRLLVIYPFDRIILYQLNRESEVLLWDLRLPPVDKNIYSSQHRNFTFSEYYFISEDALYMPYSIMRQFYIRKVDLKAGKDKGSTIIPGIKGQLYNFYGGYADKNRIGLIISNNCNPYDPDDFKLCFTSASIIYTHYLEMSKDGNIGKLEHFPESNVDGFEKVTGCKTNNCFIYTVLGNILTVDRLSN
ncbi:MAG: hypothetical protein WDL87_08275 [Candidatus Omnitrophota bacterium]